MPSTEVRTWKDEPQSVLDQTERDALIKHYDSIASYGSNSRSSSIVDNESDFEGPGRRDEEALIDSGSHIDPPKQTPSPSLSTKTIIWIVLPMLLAVFISNADATIVMATHALVASDFMALESSSWLFTGFALASTATQTTFGQLSEIFGRKPIIMISYFIFGLGWCVLYRHLRGGPFTDFETINLVLLRESTYLKENIMRVSDMRDLVVLPARWL